MDSCTTGEVRAIGSETCGSTADHNPWFAGRRASSARRATAHTRLVFATTPNRGGLFRASRLPLSSVRARNHPSGDRACVGIYSTYVHAGMAASLGSPTYQQTLSSLAATLASIIRGKTEAIELLMIGALAGGHLLIEDVPGVGKTTLAKAFARALGFEYGRIQFTPDLLPSDILGTHTLNPKTGELSFQTGPVFTQVLLADEINRASPRTQSALLEAMSERQVTVDGKTLELPEPFIVLATQNPVDFQGTYPLPEAQLDRFILRFSLGYPNEEEELKMLVDRRDLDPLSAVKPVTSPQEFSALTNAVRAVHVSDAVMRYLRKLVAWTREQDDVALGVSPRGTLVLFRACQARALLRGRDYVTPDDVQALSVPALAHRMKTTEHARYAGKSTTSICLEAIAALAVPT